uniref:Type ISP restriction-modification enzyme coupler domain-containing protein n=1 Tax=Candidatus Kentrum sp. UNK TaxID=2126344 RepID=A0A451AU79_9GAMM|nr:MAG: hypothetical protein BECKUNK1418G_GA0071005_10151 [Candidatus Kentron sp. UNK]VFK69611.1 MAG: hypothetical protein BECKUNK1418H_GA0071006_101637 [Candidatus Kentron sp. UNK]
MTYYSVALGQLPEHLGQRSEHSGDCPGASGNGLSTFGNAPSISGNGLSTPNDCQTTSGNRLITKDNGQTTSGDGPGASGDGINTSGNGPSASGNPTSSNGFAANNPVSQGMQKVLSLLHQHHLEKETDTLQAFYASVCMRAEGIDNAAGRQRILLELYDKFFRNAFPRLTKRLGIVYTPVEVVDFILHSIEHLLRNEQRLPELFSTLYNGKIRILMF